MKLGFVSDSLGGMSRKEMLDHAQRMGVSGIVVNIRGWSTAPHCNMSDVMEARWRHHPCGAPYGFEMYYLNVKAGPLRKWRFVPAPEVEWIMHRDAD